MAWERSSLRFDFQYKYPRNEDSYENTTTVPFKVNNRGSVVTHYAFSVGYGYYPIVGSGFYVAGDFMLRYGYYEDVYYYDCAGTSSDSRVFLESSYRFDTGIKPQAGIKLALNKTGKVKVMFDFYGGPVFFFRRERKITYAERYGYCSNTDMIYYDTPEEERIFRPGLELNLGINFTIAF